MATTGANTSSQWRRAALDADQAHYEADLKAFSAEKATLDAERDAKFAIVTLDRAKVTGDAVEIGRAQQQLQAANNKVTQQQVVASEYRTQSNNALAAADAAEALAAKNSGLTPTTTPPATATPGQPATTYIPTPEIEQATSPAPALTTTYQANATVVTNTTTTNTTVTDTTGGSSTTRYSFAPKDTEASKTLDAQGDKATKEAALFYRTPNTPFAQRALDTGLADGTITQAQYDTIKNSSPAERLALADEAAMRAGKLYGQANAEKIKVPPETVVTNQPNTSEVTVDTAETTSVATATVTGTIPGTNVATATVDGQEYQVTKNINENTSTYTATDNAAVSVTVPTTNIENAAPKTINNNVFSQAAFDQEFNELNADQDRVENAAPIPINVAQNATETNQESQDKKLPEATGRGATEKKLITASQATQQDVVNFQAKADWRVRLSLSPGATYLYNARPDPGILAPLIATDGVIFPYTPAISVQYNATYDPTELTHSNYKFFTYRGSAVDSVTIGCDFTAQDTFEAQYVLAVIHFFRSITKMFYGQDQNPRNGTPPPLCYLSGLGAFQFDAHPLAITAFTYTLPTDVDYIQAGSDFAPAGVNRQNNPAQGKPGESSQAQAGAVRMDSGGINPGATVSSPVWQTTNVGTKEATYVPTKISLSITAVPIVTRNDISNRFSLEKYATGSLLRGSRNAGGGIW